MSGPIKFKLVPVDTSGPAPLTDASEVPEDALFPVHLRLVDECPDCFALVRDYSLKAHQKACHPPTALGFRTDEEMRNLKATSTPGIPEKKKKRRKVETVKTNREQL